jgi:5'-3' exonuclease
METDLPFIDEKKLQEVCEKIDLEKLEDSEKKRNQFSAPLILKFNQKSKEISIQIPELFQKSGILKFLIKFPIEHKSKIKLQIEPYNPPKEGNDRCQII